MLLTPGVNKKIPSTTIVLGTSIQSTRFHPACHHRNNDDLLISLLRRHTDRIGVTPRWSSQYILPGNFQPMAPFSVTFTYATVLINVFIWIMYQFVFKVKRYSQFHTAHLVSNFFLTWKNAGTKNMQANIHASGDAKQANVNPNFGTINTPISPLAIISINPDTIANDEKPRP